MRGKRRGHDPLMMWLMQRLVDSWVMKSAMDEVDEEIREDEERGELREVVPRPWTLLGGVVELRVAAAFGDEAGGG